MVTRIAHTIMLLGVALSAVGDDGVILVFGQKAFCISQLTKGEDCTAKQILHKLHYLTTVTELSDWILDVLWLMYKDPSHYRIAFVTAHNAVLVYSVTEGSVSVFTHDSEINCILYPNLLYWHTFSILGNCYADQMSIIISYTYKI